MIDWLIDLLIDWLIAGLISSFKDWSIERLIDLFRFICFTWHEWMTEWWNDGMRLEEFGKYWAIYRTIWLESRLRDRSRDAVNNFGRNCTKAIAIEFNRKTKAQTEMKFSANELIFEWNKKSIIFDEIKLFGNYLKSHKIEQ